jgi:cytochrome c5
MRLNFMVLLTVYSLQLFAVEDLDRQLIQQRIQPIGKVHIQDQKDSSPQSEESVPEVAKEERPGQHIYEQYCGVCHRDGVAGAPKFHEVNDWKPRMDGKTIDELVAIAIKGLNAMPPKGTCGECSDADLKAAIQFMLPQP